MKEAIFLTQERPFPPRGGGRIRDAALALLLAENASTELLCFEETHRASLPDSPPLPFDAGRSLVITAVPRERRPLRERAVYPLRPYVLNGYSLNMEAALRARAPDPARPGPPRLLWVSRLAMGKYIPLARKLGFRVILDEHNVESDLLLRAALRSPRGWSAWRAWKDLPLAWQCRVAERKFCRQAHAVVATSGRDLDLLRKLANPPSLWLLPNSVDCSVFESAREEASARRFTILFPGTLDYEPNREGLLWFRDRILPRLRGGWETGFPPLRILVAGANPSPELRSALEAAGIVLHANPESMLPHFREASLVIVPLLSGGGTRLKILEAMAAGRPVVSTSKGAEGLDLEPGAHLLIADEPEGFARAIVSLAADTPKRLAMARRALERVRSHHDWRALRPTMARILDTVAGEAGTRQGSAEGGTSSTKE